MIGFVEFILVTISISIIVFVKLLEINPPPIFGVYQRRNGFYWFKVTITYCLLSLRKLKAYKTRHEKINNLEKPQKLFHEQAADTVCMSGSNKSGDHLSVRIETRKDCKNSQLHLKINSSELGVLAATNLSDSSSTTPDENAFEFSAEGIKLLPLEPMGKWRFVYKGKIFEKGNRNVEHQVKIDGVWMSQKPYFYFDTDMDTLQTSKCLAYENFHETQLENLKLLLENRSEQFGTMKLNVAIDQKSYEIDLDAIKIRSVGNCKDWSLYHRYGVHYFVTENGDCFGIGAICQPTTSSRFSFGHVYSAKDKKIYPIKDTSLKLYQYGGIEVPPEDYGFTFSAGEQNYAVKVKVLETSHFHVGKRKEGKLYERFAMFELNGLKGWGLSQWEYRNVDGDCGSN